MCRNLNSSGCPWLPARLNVGQADRRWIGLHPREFALMWRLAECPGEQVTKEALWTDVWRLRHEPETNSLEVHVSRLRDKLALSVLAWLVQTHPDGGYCLSTEGGASFKAFARDRRAALDSGAMITQERRLSRESIVESHVQQPRYD